ncbi:alcohol dehydrogenase catalytic domain-containing protein [Natronorubrum sp. JWXQ-INN-674]|uniref:Alcohol dehydrogenase catalytic domain-containing protein n=1 Tax=Natronorubrum halalkaliphilum TaxID=2691917 RepID=A0A6B0VG68_9EURY|nr:alcohol dehydrogenase catalytic domain-containing protein [Natronorubrum halalkaliphilum]MXV60480.1 alcohol dehydrogenase catalytic domain-containing protein [Natronorubrum halalkaliphilum]
MRAIVTDGNNDIWEEDRERPVPGAGEALVRVRAVGICGSDIGLIRGEGPPWTDYPLVPGHEVCAEVVELGPGIDSLSVGDRVSLHGFVYCGTCRACREGRYYQCTSLEEIGFTIDGGYREYAAFPVETLRPLEDEINDLEATQIDSAGCTLHALKRVETSFTDTAAVFGPGSLGLFGVQLLKAKGIDDIVLTGLHDERLAVGERYGAVESINIRETDPANAIDDYTDGTGIDLCLEAAGAGDVVNTCLTVAGTQGSVILTGVFDGSREIDPNDIVAKELEVVGSVTAANAVDEIAALFRTGDLSVDGIVTHEFDLAEYETALETVRNRDDGVIKAVLRP